jgi:LmbE family N-acetylglucosaminyl deacetylase
MNLEINNQRVLILAPHTDDGELGCGAIISKLIENNNEVFEVAFSICEDSVPDGFPKDILAQEFKAATAELGLPKENIFIKNYPVRKFPAHRQEILEDLIHLRKLIDPNIVFMPCSNALHQDHKTIYEEGLRAFKHFTCFGYDLPWDTTEFSTTAFFKIEERHVEKKWNAIDKYLTQKFRTYIDKDFIFGLSRVRGAQISVKYAEAFELIRIIF